MNLRPEAARRILPAVFVRAVGLCVLALLLVMVIGHFLPDATRRTEFSDLNSPVADLLATVFLFVAAMQTARRSKRLALAWGVLALAELLYAMGDAIWAILEVFLHQAPFPSIADPVYLAYYPVFLVGIVLLLRKPHSAGEAVNDWLDLAVILTAAILGFGNYLIGPILLTNVDAPAVEQFILAAYPVGDLVMLGALLLLLYSDPHPVIQSDRHASAPVAQQPVIPVLLLAAGMVAMILTDCVYSYRSLLGTYSTGGMLDLGWIIADLLFVLAAAAQCAAMQPDNAISSYKPGPVFQAWISRTKTYLPYVWLVGAFALLVRAATTALPMSFSWIATGVSLILAFVLVRQFITLSENHRLTLRLKEQAASLESVNRDLKTEIDERLHIQEKLAFDVLHDQMTGLANRRLFLDRLGQAIKRCKRHQGMCFGVLFMDLDQFKVVNDSLGHATGDQLLISVAKRLVENLRAGDTVARFGGDEFAILLDDLDEEDSARAIAEKLMHVIEQPFHLNDRDVHVTASIGIATDLVKYEYAEDLLRDVDLAMYQAKARGKARCVMFRPDMRDQAFSRLALEDEMRSALKNNEFRLFYQPITSLESDQVVAVEALLRWFHPVRGMLLPAEFLTIAEESDLILPMGDWVLREACSQLKKWQEQYPPLAHLAVNVNISNREFAQPHLAGKVYRALELSGLQGSCLRLEITERVLVENYPTANASIAALNDMGVRVEIDDFGTGYSALAYLQQFPINAIKIDKSFITDMRRNRKGLGLVRAIVSMARELGMETIAEGIETREQLSELKGLLCGFGQGYLLSRPLDAATVEGILARVTG
jgi:diguanylate cyclase (GGDEF)-like protein